LVIPCNISMGGNTITLASALARRVREKCEKQGLSTPQALADCVADARPLTLGVVHAYSTHNLLLRYWLATAGIHAGHDVRLTVIPPARAVEALTSGQIMGFCAGAPWGEIASRAGTGITVASSDDVWRTAPEKAFALRASWAEEHPAALKGAVRALVRAAQFCDAPENASYTAALLSRQKYLGVDSHAILSSLPGGAIAQNNLSRFFRGAATFPWRSHALWFLEQMARWDLIGDVDAQSLAARVYRSDLYRAAVAPLGISVPRADSKSEGAHDAPWSLEATPRPIAMGPDSFCDGVVFDGAPAPASF
jgi:NitT/TauT family transport system ATP-binding protein/nitrate/nitrite transport system substrate-binding protein